MIESMTGYGEAQARVAGTEVLCRIRSLNHRFLEIKVRTPWPNMSGLEIAIRKRLGEAFRRGAIDVSLITAAKRQERVSRVNYETAESYSKAARALSRKLGEKHPPLSLDTLLRLPGVVSSEDESDALKPEHEDQLLEKAVVPSIRALQKARQAEGKKLLTHLTTLLDQLEENTKRIAALEEPEKARAREQMKSRVEETLQLLGAAATDDFSARLNQEAAIWIERRDFDEERVRFGAHLSRVRQLLRSGAPDGLGRRIEFFHQELLRETNTLGTKAQSTAVTEITVEMKALLERLREQIANVE